MQFNNAVENYIDSIMPVLEDKSLRIDETIQISMHDFGFRGATSVEQSVLGGMFHLLNFAGIDTMTAAYVAQQENEGTKPVGFSIPATEHSVMTSFEKEKDAIKNMFVKYIKQDSPFSIFAIVMDSYDYTRALFKELPNAIMDYNNGETTFTEEGLILNNDEQKVNNYKNYKVVLRPDSGDSIEVVLLGLVAACAIFGWTEYTVGDKTYIQCKNSGVIQGDGINVHKLEEILQTLTGTKEKNEFLTKYNITSETDSQMESWFKEKSVASSGGAEAKAPAATSNGVTQITTYKNEKPIYKYEMTLKDYMNKIISTNTNDNKGDNESTVRITHALKDQVNNVLKKLETAYFTPDCMAFGMGGGLIQKVNRDTMKFATKLCSSTQDKNTVIVMKNPATDPENDPSRNMDVITVKATENNNIPFQVVSLENLDKQTFKGKEVEITKGDDNKGESLMTVKYTKDTVDGITEHFGKKRAFVNTGWNDLRTYIEGKKDKQEYYPKGRNADYYDKTAKPHFSTKLNDMQQFYDPSQKKFVIKKKDTKKATTEKPAPEAATTASTVVLQGNPPPEAAPAPAPSPAAAPAPAAPAAPAEAKPDITIPK